MRPLLLCTDLDRTLLPNGTAPESPRARALFRFLREAVGQEPFFCILGDTILKADYQSLLACPDNMIGVREVENPSAPARSPRSTMSAIAAMSPSQTRCTRMGK